MTSNNSKGRKSTTSVFWEVYWDSLSETLHGKSKEEIHIIRMYLCSPVLVYSGNARP